MPLVDDVVELQKLADKIIQHENDKIQRDNEMVRLKREKDIDDNVNKHFDTYIKPSLENTETIIKENILNRKSIVPFNCYKSCSGDYVTHVTKQSQIFGVDMNLNDFELEAKLCIKTNEFLNKINKDKKWGFIIKARCGFHETYYDGEYGGYVQINKVEMVVP